MASLLTNGAGASLVVALSTVVLWVVTYAVNAAYSELASFAVGLAGWVVLPTVVGLFRPRRS